MVFVLNFSPDWSFEGRWTQVPRFWTFLPVSAVNTQPQLKMHSPHVAVIGMSSSSTFLHPVMTGNYLCSCGEFLLGGPLKFANFKTLLFDEVTARRLQNCKHDSFVLPSHRQELCFRNSSYHDPLSTGRGMPSPA